MKTHRRTKLTIYLLELCVLFFLGISIITFDSNDPGYSSVGSVEGELNQEIITNKAGFFGAYISDFLFYYLGIASYILIALCTLSFIAQIFCRNNQSLFSNSLLDTIFVVLFFPVLLLSVCGLIAFIYPYTDTIWLPHGTGGVFGKSVALMYKAILGEMGSITVLVISILISIILLYNIALFRLLNKAFELIIKALIAFSRYIIALFAIPKSADSNKKRMHIEDINVGDVASSEAQPQSFISRSQQSNVGNLNNKEFVAKNANDGIAFPATKKTRFTIDKSLNPLDLKPEELERLLGAHNNPPAGADTHRIKADNFYRAKKPQTVFHREYQNPIDTERKTVNDRRIEITLAKKSAANINPTYTNFTLPKTSLLQQKKSVNFETQRELDSHYQSLRIELVTKLEEFGINAEVIDVTAGPVVTRFEIQPAAGIKASRISNLAQDIARSLAVSSVRVVEVIEGRSTIGIEIPNRERKMVYLQEILDSEPYLQSEAPLSIALGHDIAGKAIVTDLAKTPHLLVAGTTGAGKSVAINTMIMSLLYKSSPEDVRLIMIDPKMLELSMYEDIPHLLTPVVTDMNLASSALLWSVAEMERRYKIIQQFQVRNIDRFNEVLKERKASGEYVADPSWVSPLNDLEQQPPELHKMPYIVIIIDEFADMMTTVGKKVEQLIARITQKARAAGIHLILATQRPSVDVITGLIKSNIPSRIAFQVSSKIDSRTILDQGGAEQLLGNGDMLFMPSGTSVPMRVHGAFVSDEEVIDVVNFVREQGAPNYIHQITAENIKTEVPVPGFKQDKLEGDELLDTVIDYVLRTRKSSISGIQRQFNIGYNRAAKLIDKLEEMGVVTEPAANGNRQVLPPPPID